LFADGTVWTRADLRVKLLAQASTSGNDTITGFNVADIIRGGAGNDTINGAGGTDTYLYARGDGNDTITETESYNELQRMRVGWRPCRLCNGLGAGDQCEQDEAIHPPLILGSNDRIRIEAAIRIARLCRHDSSDPRGQGSRPFGKGRQP
jgi:hypothetical protein